MRAFLGAEPVCDLRTTRQTLAEHGRAAPPEFARANVLLNPLGRAPAKGWFLLSRASLDKLNLNDLLSLSLETKDSSGQTTSSIATAGSTLVITKEPLSLTAGVTANDADSAYLVEVADARWRARLVPVNRYYNVRAGDWDTGGNPYYVDSMQDGTAPWSWSGMVGDLWGLLQPKLGPYPGLPYNPTGIPEGWQFPGVYAWDALCDVLWKLDCAVAWDLTGGVYQIVQVGLGDPDALAVLTAADQADRRTLDGEYLTRAVRGRLPSGVTVYFHVQYLYYGSEQTARGDAGALAMNLVYAIDMNIGPAGAEPGTHAIVWDDLPALYDASGTLTNLTALTSRASVRAQDFYRMAQGGGDRMHKTYMGLLALSPGSQIKGVAYRQVNAPGGNDDGALVTDVVRHPYRELRSDDPTDWQRPDGADSEPTQPPDFRQGLPTYPALTPPALRVLSGTPVTGDVYNANVQHNDLTPAWSDKESVWALDMSSAGSVEAGTYPARLLGAFTHSGSTRPLYTFRPGGAAAADSVQILAALLPTPGPAWIPDGMGGYTHPTGLRYGYPAVLLDASGGTYTLRGLSFTITSGLARGTATVNVASTAGISIGTVLLIVATVPITLFPGGDLSEFVTVTGVTPTTFTAVFANDYSAGSGDGTAYTAGAWLQLPNGGTVVPNVDDIGDNLNTVLASTVTGDTGTYPIPERPNRASYYLARYAGAAADGGPVYTHTDAPYDGFSGQMSDGNSVPPTALPASFLAGFAGGLDGGPGGFSIAFINRDGWEVVGSQLTARYPGLYQMGGEVRWGNPGSGVTAFACEVHLVTRISAGSSNDRVVSFRSIPKITATVPDVQNNNLTFLTQPQPMMAGDYFYVLLYVYGTGTISATTNHDSNAWVNKLA